MDHVLVFLFTAEDGTRAYKVTGVQTCALPISRCCGVSGVLAHAPARRTPRSSAPPTSVSSRRPTTWRGWSAAPRPRRSEEHRVGKEWREGGGGEARKKKKRGVEERIWCEEAAG